MSNRSSGRQVVGLLAFLWLAVLRPAPAAGQTRLTQDEALRLAFPPPATVERRTAFLDEDALARAREAAGPGVALEQRVITYYVGRAADGTPLGVAYFDAHRVRTLAEVLMVVVTPEARVGRIELLSFAEPPEYRAPDGWLDQLEDRGLTDGLSLRGAIVNMTGATLTARAAVGAARRVLALHRVIDPLGTEGR